MEGKSGDEPNITTRNAIISPTGFRVMASTSEHIRERPWLGPFNSIHLQE